MRFDETKVNRFESFKVDSDDPTTKENSPLKKKFKFSPTSSSTQSMPTNDVKTEITPPPKFKFKAVSHSSDSPSSANVDKPIVAVRKGFVAPKRNPDIYGDEDSDDDFQ